MTHTLTAADVHELLQVDGELCVSILMPTAHVEAEFEQNPIRLKNLLSEAERRLDAYGVDDARAEKVLAPPRDLLDNDSFWHRMGAGLALYLTPEVSYVHRLAVDVPEMVTVNTHFHVAPLARVLNDQAAFYLLALSQNEVKLYQGDAQALEAVDAPDLPESLQQALFYDDPEESLQSHAGTVTAAGRHDAIHHGQGVNSDDGKGRPHDQIRRFFDKVNEGIMATLGDATVPLYLACVEEYLPIYREANDYPHLVTDRILAGNPEDATSHELYQKALGFVREAQALQLQAALQSFSDQKGARPELVAESVEDVVPAAHFGQVDTLFLRDGAHAWGLFDEDRNRIELNEKRQPGDGDLLNLAVMETIRHGGAVHILPSEQVDDGTNVRALLRYPADIEAEPMR